VSAFQAFEDHVAFNPVVLPATPVSPPAEAVSALSGFSRIRHLRLTYMRKLIRETARGSLAYASGCD
jgi:hypothetical protein